MFLSEQQFLGCSIQKSHFKTSEYFSVTPNIFPDPKVINEKIINI